MLFRGWTILPRRVAGMPCGRGFSAMMLDRMLVSNSRSSPEDRLHREGPSRMKGYFSIAFATMMTACAIVGLGLIPGVPDAFSFLALLPLVLYHLYLRGWPSFIFPDLKNRGDAEI